MTLASSAATEEPDPDVPLMRSLARPERVTGEDRKKLAKLIADRHKRGATFAQLAETIQPSEGLVRALVMDTGVSIRPSPALPAAPEPETTEPIMWVAFDDV